MDLIYDINSHPDISYTNMTMLCPGIGNTNVDPGFYLNGYWADMNDISVSVDPFDSSAVWIEGDYHLTSEVGRWDALFRNWVTDAYSSRLIDAGDPNSDWSDEPLPSGERINMGAYGGTNQASLSSP